MIVSPPDQSDPTDRAAERRRQLADLQAAYSSALVGTVPDLGYPFAEGVKVRLDLFAGRWWCVFEPFTHVDLPKRAAAPPGGAQGEAQAPEDANAEPDVHGAADWRRERWARRYNPVWAKIIDAWAHLLAPEGADSIQTAAMAIKAGVQIVPVACSGAHRVMEKRKLRIRPGKIVVEFLAPIDAAEYSFERREELNRRMHDELAAGLPEDQRPLPS